MCNLKVSCHYDLIIRMALCQVVCCQRRAAVTGGAKPNPAAVEQYERDYAQYRNLYPALTPTFHALGEA